MDTRNATGTPDQGVPANHDNEQKQDNIDEQDGNRTGSVFHIDEVTALGERYVRHCFERELDEDACVRDFIVSVERLARNVATRARDDEQARGQRDREEQQWNRGSRSTPLASEVMAVYRPPVTTYTTGLPELDRLIGGGITTRSVTGIVSRTGAGKSGKAITIGMHVMRTYNVPLLYISTELDGDECGARFAAHVLNVSHGDILRGTVPRSKAQAALAGLPLHIVDCERIEPGAKAIDTIKDAIDRVTAMYGVPPVVIVDYLQELVDTDPRNDRLGFTEIARTMRRIAQEHELTMIVVSSVSRGFYKQPEKGADDPLTYLSAAKESGDIEYAVANLLYLDVAPEHVQGVYSARIVVAKARRGSLGFVGASFHGPSGRWEQHAGALVEMSADRRRIRVKDDEKTRDEDTMLRAITDASKAGTRRTANTWRNSGVVPQERANAAVKRLLAAGRLVSEVGFCSSANREVSFVVPPDSVRAPTRAPRDPNSPLVALAHKFKL